MKKNLHFLEHLQYLEEFFFMAGEKMVIFWNYLISIQKNNKEFRRIFFMKARKMFNFRSKSGTQKNFFYGCSKSLEKFFKFFRYYVYSMTLVIPLDIHVLLCTISMACGGTFHLVLHIRPRFDLSTTNLLLMKIQKQKNAHLSNYVGAISTIHSKS